MKKHITTFSAFALFLFFDFITKHLVEKYIAFSERIDVIGSFVQLTRIYNRGGVFGIMQGHQTFFLIVSAIVLLLLVGFYLYEKEKSTLFCFSMGLIFSGAVGNILDRAMGKPGVVDFIYIGSDEVYRWPAFNIADASIVVGAVILAVIFYRQESRRKSEKN